MYGGLGLMKHHGIAIIVHAGLDARAVCSF